MQPKSMHCHSITSIEHEKLRLSDVPFRVKKTTSSKPMTTGFKRFCVLPPGSAQCLRFSSSTFLSNALSLLRESAGFLMHAMLSDSGPGLIGSSGQLLN